MILLKETDWCKKVLTTLQRFSNPKVTPTGNFQIPKHTVFHYIGGANHIGPEVSYPLIRGLNADLPVHFITKLEPLIGTPTNVNINLLDRIKYYHKVNGGFFRVSDINKSIVREIPIFLSYGLLTVNHKYTLSKLMNYYEWFNIRATMWANVERYNKYEKTHFIKYDVPLVLPDKSILKAAAKSYTNVHIPSLYTQEHLDLLELWRIISPDVDDQLNILSDSTISKVVIALSIPGFLICVKLEDLISGSLSDPSTFSTKFYNLLDKFNSYRTNVELVKKELTGEPDALDFPVEVGLVENHHSEELLKILTKNAEDGLLTKNEYNSLVKLASKHTTILDPHGSGATLDKMVVTKEDLTVPKTVLTKNKSYVTDESLKESNIISSDLKYIEEVMPKHIVQSFLQYQASGFIIKDIKFTDTVDVITRKRTYNVSLQPVDGAASSVSFTIPVLEKDGSYKSGGVKYRLAKQKGDLPIFKIKEDVVALTSFYGKLFITRNTNVSNNISRWIVGELTKRYNDSENTSVSKLSITTNTFVDSVLPRMYTAIGMHINAFSTPLYDFYFNFNKLNKFFKEDEIALANEHNMVPCGRNSKSLLLVMDELGMVYQNNNKGGFDALGSIPTLIDSEMGEGPMEYSDIEVFNKKVPLGLALTYMHGWEGFLKLLNIPNSIVVGSVTANATGKSSVVKFKDATYVCDVSDPRHKLLIGGVLSVETTIRRMNSSDLNNKSSYTAILSKLNLRSSTMAEIEEMYKLYIDPITLSVLKEMEEPTTFEGLVLKANQLLINDSRPKVYQYRYKGNERIVGFIYKAMVDSVKDYRRQGFRPNAQITVNPNAVFLKCLQDESIMLLEETNPIQQLKEREFVTFSGEGGRSAVTMVKSTRVFNESDFGVMSEVSPDNGKTGINAYSTANPNFSNLLGMTNKYTDGGVSSLLSTTSLLAPAVTHDDSKRVGHINGQHTHGVGCVNYSPLPYRTGYEEMIGLRGNGLFTQVAEDDGTVTKVTNTAITVKYKTKGEAVFKLGVTHGVSSGKSIPHDMITDLKVGDNFKERGVLAWVDTFFKRSPLTPDNVQYAHGVLTRCAFLESEGTLEDSTILSDFLVRKLVTPQSKMIPIIVTKDMDIHNLLKIGDIVEPDTILCTVENSLLGGYKENDTQAIQELSELSLNNVLAKVSGTITNIEVLYYFQLEDDTIAKSIIDIITLYDGIRAKNSKLNGGIKVGRIKESIRVGRKKVVADEIVIKVFIDYNLPLAVADKVVLANGAKLTISEITEKPSISSKDGLAVDSITAWQTISNRIIDSPEISGLAITNLIEISAQAADIYFSE